MTKTIEFLQNYELNGRTYSAGQVAEVEDLAAEDLVNENLARYFSRTVPNVSLDIHSTQLGVASKIIEVKNNG